MNKLYTKNLWPEMTEGLLIDCVNSLNLPYVYKIAYYDYSSLLDDHKKYDTLIIFNKQIISNFNFIKKINNNKLFYKSCFGLFFLDHPPDIDVFQKIDKIYKLKFLI